MKLPQISQEGNLNSMQIIDCRFISNTAQTGAALHIDTFLTGEYFWAHKHFIVRNILLHRIAN